MAEEQRGLSHEQRRDRLAGGLGASRHKEYDIAPYAYIVRTNVSKGRWSGVFYSWLSMKGHLQGLHGHYRSEAYATAVGDRIYATFIVVWRYSEALAEWMESGYPIEKMLAALGVEEQNIEVTLMRSFS